VEQSGRFAGEWNITNAEELRARFVAFLASGGDVALDLGGVESCDTAALQLLCSLRRTAKERGVRVRLLELPPAIVELARALGLAPEELTDGAGGGV